jgi:hypothetical protein
MKVHVKKRIMKVSKSVIFLLEVIKSTSVYLLMALGVSVSR